MSEWQRWNVSCAVGGLDIKSQEAALRQLPDIVIATPGRLIDHLHNAPSFHLNNVEVLILDEADRLEFDSYRQWHISLSLLSSWAWLVSSTWQDIHSVPEKQPLWFLIITLANEHRFSQFFYCEIPQEIFYRPVIEIFTSPYSCVATLPCEIWKSNIFVFQKQSLPLLIIIFIPHSLTLWPPNSPDLNPVDYAVWGILQECVYKHHRIRDVEELR